MTDGSARWVRIGLARAVLLFLGASVGSVAADDVPETFVETMAWYEEQANAGNAEAQYLLGYARETGTATGFIEIDPQDVQKNPERARELYAMAAEQDHHRAQVRLAVMMLNGRGGPVDARKALFWLSRSAMGGEPDGMAILGVLLLQQEPPSITEAYRWLSLAAEAGNRGGRENLELLKNMLSDEELNGAETALRDWLASRSGFAVNAEN